VPTPAGPPRALIAAGHPLTAEAGAAVLRDGGNAVDAAVAAMLMSWAAEPLLTGPGAGGYLLVAGLADEPALLDFFVAAPGLGRERAVAAPDLTPVVVNFGDAVQVFNCGAASVGVPGCPAGIGTAMARWGTRRLAALAEPAAAAARAGVAVNEPQGYVFDLLEGILASTPEAVRAFGARTRFASAELADTIELLGREGAEPFYRGAVAEAIAEWLEPRGGLVTRADLAAYQAVVRAPVWARYRGRTVVTNPPPSAGGTLIALALSLLDRTDGPPSVLDIVGVMARAQSERTDAFVAGLDQPGFAHRFLSSRLGSTTHISVVDGEGRACSVTCTNGEGSGVVVPGTGIHLNNIMGEEDLNPLGFHVFPAGRRMPSMMAPTVVLAADGAVELVLGSAGSNRIRSAILQTILNVVDFNLKAQNAVELPRLHLEHGVVEAEPGVDPRALESLERAGWAVQRWQERNLYFGGVQAVARDPESGEFSGGGDPRRGGAAVVVD
jgi:gamma-glutamyltranspeptidase/glutathione hydrolase